MRVRFGLIIDEFSVVIKWFFDELPIMFGLCLIVFRIWDGIDDVEEFTSAMPEIIFIDTLECFNV
jgi:hypothetical protein